MATKYRVVVLTEREYHALCNIVNNGWGDGGYRGYGRENPRTQLYAMQHLGAATINESETEDIPLLRKCQQHIVSQRHGKK